MPNCALLALTAVIKICTYLHITQASSAYSRCDQTKAIPAHSWVDVQLHRAITVRNTMCNMYLTIDFQHQYKTGSSFIITPGGTILSCITSYNIVDPESIIRDIHTSIVGQVHIIEIHSRRSWRRNSFIHCKRNYMAICFIKSQVAACNAHHWWSCKCKHEAMYTENKSTLWLWQYRTSWSYMTYSHLLLDCMLQLYQAVSKTAALKGVGVKERFIPEAFANCLQLHSISSWQRFISCDPSSIQSFSVAHLPPAWQPPQLWVSTNAINVWVVMHAYTHTHTCTYYTTYAECMYTHAVHCMQTLDVQSNMAIARMRAATVLQQITA